ncbi:MAG TPA: hypothetical protein VG367_20435 [Mucilaginibacter sp.]|jgi:hypothetical protein|nr:hypothetical protein [Mucilaginibacter sp.]
MLYKITFKNQFRALRAVIYGGILLAIIGYVFYRNHHDYDMESLIFALKAGAVCYLILIIPALFLHLEYYIINKKDIVVINDVEGTISINNQQPIAFDQIEKIFLLMSPPLYRNDKINYIPFDNYYYAIIKMKEGGRFIFTSLLTPKVEEVMKQINGVPIEKRRRLIASPLLGRYWFSFWS